MSNRGKLGYRQSQRIFTKNAVKHKALNSDVAVFRGGIRL